MSPKRKVILAVAPVAHKEKTIPSGAVNPTRSADIAREVIECARAGASLVHLHVRDEEGKQIAGLESFSRTIDMVRAASDIVIQGSTGGLSTLSLEDRSASVNEPRVQMASLNMGSTNFGEGVYINTWSDIRYWASKMKRSQVIPELEIFDLSMIESVMKLADEGSLDRPLHFNFSLGFKGALAATADNIFRLKQALPPGSSWSFIHEGMEDFSLIGMAVGCGASGIRVGYEDGFYLEPGLIASNAELVAKAAALIRLMGCEPATCAEARQMLGILK